MITGLSILIRKLEALKTAFDADVIGDQVLDIIAAQQSREFDAEADATGAAWPALSESYAEWKGKHGLGMQMGILEGVMAGDDTEFKGERSFTKTEARMTFGTSQQARDEAAWFIAGDTARNRPPRPFLGISAESERLVGEFLEARLKQLV